MPHEPPRGFLAVQPAGIQLYPCKARGRETWVRNIPDLAGGQSRQPRFACSVGLLRYLAGEVAHAGVVRPHCSRGTDTRAAAKLLPSRRLELWISTKAWDVQSCAWPQETTRRTSNGKASSVRSSISAASRCRCRSFRRWTTAGFLEVMQRIRGYADILAVPEATFCIWACLHKIEVPAAGLHAVLVASTACGLAFLAASSAILAFFKLIEISNTSKEHRGQPQRLPVAATCGTFCANHAPSLPVLQTV